MHIWDFLNAGRKDCLKRICDIRIAFFWRRFNAFSKYPTKPRRKKSVE